jgi:hypothetical protein
MTPIPKGDRTEREQLEDRTPAVPDDPPDLEEIRRQLGWRLVPVNDDVDPD